MAARGALGSCRRSNESCLVAAVGHCVEVSAVVRGERRVREGRRDVKDGAMRCKMTLEHRGYKGNVQPYKNLTLCHETIKA